MVIVAALARYNPCVVYARRGVPCSFFNRKPPGCGIPLGSCNMAEYDGWFKDVREGLTKCFFPNKIRALEIPGTYLLIYHTHKKAIVGEAKIIEATVRDNNHYYRFDKFLVYPAPVEIRRLQTDPRLFKLSRVGRWSTLRISEVTLEEMRNLSGIRGKTRKELTRDTELVKQDVEKFEHLLCRKPFSLFNEERKLSESGIESEVLRKAEEIFLDACRRKLSIGRSQKTLYYASLYLAYRSIGIPAKPSQIQKLAHIREQRMFDLTLQLLSQKLGISLSLLSPKEWINYNSKKLGMSKEAIKSALEYADNIKAVKILKYKRPSAISAAAVYLACQSLNQDITQERIGNTFGVSEPTIRHLVKLYQNKLSSQKNGENSLQNVSTNLQAI